jgi:neutral/alkaline ceramidase-like enzyme
VRGLTSIAESSSGRVRRRLLVVALVMLAACWPTAPGAAPRDPSRLVAGAASVEVSFPPGIPLAGYGGFPRRAWMPDVFGRHRYAFWFRPSTGVHDPFTVRSLVLESRGVRVLWLAADLVGTDPSLLAELRERLGRQGLRYAAVIASASHTHSGPGAYSDSALFAFVAVDRRSSAVRNRILDGFERAAREAEGHKVPARIGSARTEVRDIAESRVRQPLDPELGIVKLTGLDGRPVALLWNYAIHGTALGRENFLLSGDLMGEASARLEREIGAPVLFVNGSVGDVSPRPRGWAGVTAAGEALAAGARRASDEARVEPDRLEVVHERIALPSPMLAVRNCVGGWAPAWLTVGLSQELPSSAEILGLMIGRTAWVTIPGELQTSLGLEIKASGRARFSHVFLAGVSNDYLGYFLGPAEYRRPSYIACASLYGERGGQIIRDAAVETLRRLGHPEATVTGRESKRAVRNRSRRQLRRVRRDGIDQGRPRSGGERVELSGERRLLASPGVPVHDAAAHRLVERADGIVHDRAGVGSLSLDGRARGLDGGADGAARGAIALTPFLVLLYPLDRRRCIGHEDAPLVYAGDTRRYRRGRHLSRSLSS